MLVVQSAVSDSATPWTAACQASLSFIISRTLLKLMYIDSIMPFNHLIHCCPLLPLPSIFPCIRIFFNESVFHIRWPKYWSFSFSISPSTEYSGLISFRIDWFDLPAAQGTLGVVSSTTIWKHQFLGSQPHLEFSLSNTKSKVSYVQDNTATEKNDASLSLDNDNCS